MNVTGKITDTKEENNMENECKHPINRLVYHDRLVRWGDRENPPEYDEWYVCKDCGARLAVEDVDIEYVWIPPEDEESDQ